MTRSTSPDDSADRRLVFHTAWGVTGDWHLAEDVTQEVLLRAREAEVPSPPSERRAWLSRVAVNRSLSSLRSSASREARELAREDTGQEREETMDSADLVERAEDLEVVRGALASLDDQHRLPLVLRYFNNFKLREVADSLGLPLPTAQSRINAGLALLEKRLSQLGYASLVPALGVQLATIPASSPIEKGGLLAGAAVASGGLWSSIKFKLAALTLTGAATAAVFFDFDDAPHADSIAIWVHHGPDQSLTDRIDDPAALESILGKLEVAAFEPVHRLVATATTLDFVAPDGSVERGVKLVDGTTLQDSSGVLHLRPGFVEALEQHLSSRHGRAVDLRSFVPSAKTSEPWTLERLTSTDVAAIGVQYRLGDAQMWKTESDRAQDLDTLLGSMRPTLALSKDEMRAQGIEAEPIWLGGYRSEAWVRDQAGRRHRLWFCSPTRLFSSSIGLIDVSPEFAEALGRLVAEEHGQVIDLFGTNADSPGRANETARLATAFEEVVSAKVIDSSGKFEGGPRRRNVDGEELDLYLEKRGKVLAELRELATQSTGHRIELRHSDGTVSGLERVELLAEGRTTLPVYRHLVRFDDGGLLWLEKGLEQRGHFLIREVDRAAEDQAQLARAKQVAGEWQPFLDVVVSCQVTFGVGDSNYMTPISGKAAKRFLASLQDSHLDTTTRSDAWWSEQGQKLDAQNSGGVDLIPGADFRFPLIFESEQTAIVPGIGRLELGESGWSVLREILAEGEEYAPEDIRLVERFDFDQSR